MKGTLLSKLALCACPPALVATTVATVPQVRRAVHHATRPAPRPAPHRQTAAAPVPAKRPCVTTSSLAFMMPEAPGGFGSVTDVPTVVATATPPGIGPRIAPIAPLVPFIPILGGPPPVGSAPPVTGTTVTQPPPLTPPPSEPAPVPEPAMWLMMLAGFGLAGAALRHHKARDRATQFGTGALRPTRGARRGTGAVPLGTMVAGALVGGAGQLRARPALAKAGSAGIKSAMIGKAALCVCPATVMAVGAVTIPPVRHAVYQATAPHAIVRPLAAVAAVPCVPVRPDVTLDAAPAAASVAATPE